MYKHNLSIFAILALLILIAANCHPWHPKPGNNLYGCVTCEDGQPLSGVWVSDGRIWAQTDSTGRYEMCSGKQQQVVFIVTPEGYTARLEGDITPRFWFPTSSDSTKKERRDFRLNKTPDERYAVLFLPDAHLCGEKRATALFDSLTVSLSRRIAGDLSGTGRKVMMVNLGDLSHDRYWYSSSFTIRDAYRFLRNTGLEGPMYSVTGNHDHDPSVCLPDLGQEDFESQAQYRELMGPAWYALNVGQQHWVMMDNMFYINTPLDSVVIPGVAGKRNYRVRFSQEPLDWLTEDFSHLAPGTEVCLCAHGPLFNARGCCHPEEQVAFLDSLAAACGTTIRFFAGHAHRMETTTSQAYPHITVYTLPAVSGNMWESMPQSRPLGLDGCEGGVEYALFDGKELSLRYETYSGANPYFRAYDMNGQRERWSTREDCTWIMKEVGDFVNYTDPAYENGILVNFWWYSEGDSIEVLEDGHPLKVTPAPFAVDPDGLYSHFNYRRRSYEGRHLCPANIELAFSRLFYARAHRSDSQIVICAKNAAGEVIAREHLR